MRGRLDGLEGQVGLLAWGGRTVCWRLLHQSHDVPSLLQRRTHTLCRSRLVQIPPALVLCPRPDPLPPRGGPVATVQISKCSNTSKKIRSSGENYTIIAMYLDRFLCKILINLWRVRSSNKAPADRWWVPKCPRT